MARREGWDFGRKMWTWRRREVRVDFSASAVDDGCSFPSSWFWFRDLIAMRSCCTSRETEKVLSVSMIATQDSLPPRDDGRIAVAVRR